jgi:hypothetical protein
MEADAGAWSISSGGIPLSADNPIVANWLGWPSVGPTYATFLQDYNIAAAEAPGTTLEDFINYEIKNNPDPTIVVQMQNLKSYLSTAGGLHDPPLYSSEVRYTTAYDANIVAQAGHTVLTKSMNIDTRNKVIGQSNLNAQTGLTFIATDNGGNVVGSENLMLDGVANPTNASDRMLCPFASAGGNVIPAYCNIIQAGSKYDLTIGSVTTNANDRFVGTDATAPVVVNYAINVKPYTASGTQVPAIGSAMAYIKAHIQESRSSNTSQVALPSFELGPITVTGAPQKAEDLTYSESSSAQGTISAFNKVIAYQSGKSLL